MFAEEIRELSDQISDSARTVHDSDKARKRIQMEKDELQNALEEAMSTLEQEEAKVGRVNIELAQVRADVDRRLAEKEDDFENTR